MHRGYGIAYYHAGEKVFPIRDRLEKRKWLQPVCDAGQAEDAQRRILQLGETNIVIADSLVHDGDSIFNLFDRKVAGSVAVPVETHSFVLVNHLPNNSVLVSKRCIKALSRGISAEGSATQSSKDEVLLPMTFFITAGRRSEADSPSFNAFVRRFSSLALGREIAETRMPPKHLQNNMWALKSVSQGSAHTITVSNNLQEIKTLVSGLSGDFVLQKYIERPLLVEQRKTTLRVFALVLDTGDIYIFRHGLVYLALDPYAPVTSTASVGGVSESMLTRIHVSSPDVVKAELTRQLGMQRRIAGDGYYHHGGETDYENGEVDAAMVSQARSSLVYTTAQLDQYLQDPTRCPDAGSFPMKAIAKFVLPRCKRVVIDAVKGALHTAPLPISQIFSDVATGEASAYPGAPAASSGSSLSSSFANVLAGGKGRRCFELFGADFLLGEDLEPWFLGFCESPDLEPLSHNPEQAEVVSRIAAGVVHIAIDPLFPAMASNHGALTASSSSPFPATASSAFSHDLGFEAAGESSRSNPLASAAATKAAARAKQLISGADAVSSAVSSGSGISIDIPANEREVLAALVSATSAGKGGVPISGNERGRLKIFAREYARTAAKISTGPAALPPASYLRKSLDDAHRGMADIYDDDEQENVDDEDDSDEDYGDSEEDDDGSLGDENSHSRGRARLPVGGKLLDPSPAGAIQRFKREAPGWDLVFRNPSGVGPGLTPDVEPSLLHHASLVQVMRDAASGKSTSKAGGLSAGANALTTVPFPPRSHRSNQIPASAWLGPSFDRGRMGWLNKDSSGADSSFQGNVGAASADALARAAYTGSSRGKKISNSTGMLSPSEAAANLAGDASDGRRGGNMMLLNTFGLEDADDEMPASSATSKASAALKRSASPPARRGRSQSRGRSRNTGDDLPDGEAGKKSAKKAKRSASKGLHADEQKMAFGPTTKSKGPVGGSSRKTNADVTTKALRNQMSHVASRVDTGQRTLTSPSVHPRWESSTASSRANAKAGSDTPAARSRSRGRALAQSSAATPARLSQSPPPGQRNLGGYRHPVPPSSQAYDHGQAPTLATETRPVAPDPRDAYQLEEPQDHPGYDQYHASHRSSASSVVSSSSSSASAAVSLQPPVIFAATKAAKLQALASHLRNVLRQLDSSMAGVTSLSEEASRNSSNGAETDESLASKERALSSAAAAAASVQRGAATAVSSARQQALQILSEGDEIRREDKEADAVETAVLQVESCFNELSRLEKAAGATAAATNAARSALVSAMKRSSAASSSASSSSSSNSFSASLAARLGAPKAASASSSSSSVVSSSASLATAGTRGSAAEGGHTSSSRSNANGGKPVKPSSHQATNSWFDFGPATSDEVVEAASREEPASAEGGTLEDELARTDKVGADVRSLLHQGESKATPATVGQRQFQHRSPFAITSPVPVTQAAASSTIFDEEGNLNRDKPRYDTSINLYDGKYDSRPVWGETPSSLAAKGRSENGASESLLNYSSLFGPSRRNPAAYMPDGADQVPSTTSAHLSTAPVTSRGISLQALLQSVGVTLPSEQARLERQQQHEAAKQQEQQRRAITRNEREQFAALSETYPFATEVAVESGGALTSKDYAYFGPLPGSSSSSAVDGDASRAARDRVANVAITSSGLLLSQYMPHERRGDKRVSHHANSQHASTAAVLQEQSSGNGLVDSMRVHYHLNQIEKQPSSSPAEKILRSASNGLGGDKGELEDIGSVLSYAGQHGGHYNREAVAAQSFSDLSSQKAVREALDQDKRLYGQKSLSNLNSSGLQTISAAQKLQLDNPYSDASKAVYEQVRAAGEEQRAKAAVPAAAVEVPRVAKLQAAASFRDAVSTNNAQASQPPPSAPQPEQQKIQGLQRQDTLAVMEQLPRQGTMNVIERRASTAQASASAAVPSGSADDAAKGTSIAIAGGLTDTASNSSSGSKLLASPSSSSLTRRNTVSGHKSTGVRFAGLDPVSEGPGEDEDDEEAEARNDEVAACKSKITLKVPELPAQGASDDTLPSLSSGGSASTRKLLSSASSSNRLGSWSSSKWLTSTAGGDDDRRSSIEADNRRFEPSSAVDSSSLYWEPPPKSQQRLSVTLSASGPITSNTAVSKSFGFGEGPSTNVKDYALMPELLEYQAPREKAAARSSKTAPPDAFFSQTVPGAASTQQSAAQPALQQYGEASAPAPEPQETGLAPATASTSSSGSTAAIQTIPSQPIVVDGRLTSADGTRGLGLPAGVLRLATSSFTGAASTYTSANPGNGNGAISSLSLLPRALLSLPQAAAYEPPPVPAQAPVPPTAAPQTPAAGKGSSRALVNPGAAIGPISPQAAALLSQPWKPPSRDHEYQPYPMPEPLPLDSKGRIIMPGAAPAPAAPVNPTGRVSLRANVPWASPSSVAAFKAQLFDQEGPQPQPRPSVTASAAPLERQESSARKSTAGPGLVSAISVRNLEAEPSSQQEEPPSPQQLPPQDLKRGVSSLAGAFSALNKSGTRSTIATPSAFRATSKDVTTIKPPAPTAPGGPIRATTNKLFDPPPLKKTSASFVGSTAALLKAGK